MPDTIQAGDIVELKGDRIIEMVVEMIEGDEALCVWLDSKEDILRHDKVCVAALKKVDK